MTAEEKIISLIRDTLILEYGEEFLELTEQEQNLIICDELKKQFDRSKAGQ